MTNAITEDHNSVILAVESKRVKFIHSCKKFGGTRTKPDITVACLTGQGATALPIVIDPKEATKRKEVTLPAIKKIWNCQTKAELENIAGGSTPTTTTAARTMRTRGNTRAASTGDKDEDQAEDEDGEPDSPSNATGAATKNIHINPVFIPIPFLAITALDNTSHDPLDIILAVKTVTKDFIEGSKDTNPAAEDPTKAAKLFCLWLYAAHMELVDETKFQIKADNEEV
jgi:hypothetical protein